MKKILAVATFFWLISINVVCAQGTRIWDVTSRDPAQATDRIPIMRSTSSSGYITPDGIATYAASSGAIATALSNKANTPTINDSPGRSLVTTTSSTGFQISATRVSRACYEGSFSTTSTIGGPAAVSVFLETADTNSTTPGDWTTKAVQTYSNTITLAVVLNQVQSNNWTMCRDIPAGKFVRIRSGSITGTASATINSTQQESIW